MLAGRSPAPLLHRQAVCGQGDSSFPPRTKPFLTAGAEEGNTPQREELWLERPVFSSRPQQSHGCAAGGGEVPGWELMGHLSPAAGAVGLSPVLVSPG